MEFKKYKMEEVATFSQGKQVEIENQYTEQKENMKRFLRIIDFTNPNEPIRYVEDFGDRYYATKDDLIMIRYGSQTCGKVVIGKEGIIANNMFKINLNNSLVLNRYAYYYLKQDIVYNYLRGSQNSSTMPSINFGILNKLEIDVPSIENQRKIIKILNDIDKKIELNNEINNNLEEQLNVLFELKMCQCNEFDERTLYDEFNVIDNRGKTPPLVDKSEYPIIDVKVLSGNSRVINYNDALKYVSKETYDTFFRSGHPQKYDLLLSTVGSLAEMKIYLESIGTIAQNVVALRHKNDYPLFMYQYLLNIRKKLTSYDIGSVQPSIKVTQFMKEIVKIPKDKKIILEFEHFAKAYTDKMVNIMQENRSLEQIRDTLLPKLMNGEIDLDNIEI